MKIFLINLDKNPERLAASKAQLDALGVEFERVRAVYGRDLTDIEKRHAVNRFRWWCAKGYRVRDGEIGCAMSHNNIYRKMIEEKIEVACVLEDDVQFDNRFLEVCLDVGKFVDLRKSQVVLLTNFTRERRNPRKTEIIPIKNDHCTAGYVLTLPAARSILRVNDPIQIPADGWSRWVKRGIIELYQAFPTVCGQEDRVTFGSDVETATMLRVSELSFIRKVLHKMKRLIGIAIDRSLPL